MDLLADFVIAMLITSCVLWVAARLFLCLNPRAEHWPSLWALALILCVLIPALGLSMRFLPVWAALPSPDTLSLHLPLPPVSVPSASGAETPLLSASLWQGLGVVALMIYLGGVVLRALILIIGRAQLRRLVRNTTAFAMADGVKGADGVKAADGITGRVAEDVEVVLSARTRSAFAWSPIWRMEPARIVLPAIYVQQMTPAQIADIITHERTHIARHDDGVGLVLRGLICLCWVSPFAHRLFARWSQSIEIQCDMAVTDGRSPQMRRAYAETLLQALHIMAGRVRQYPAAAFSTPSFWKKDIRTEKMRLAHIVNGTRPSFKRGRDRISLGVTAACLTLAGTFGVAATATADTPQAKATSTIISDIVSGRLSAPFGKSYDPFRNGEARIHKGIDIAAPLGTPIYAPASGTIQAATAFYDGKPNYGTVVVLETEGGVTTLFSHLDSYTVRAGQRVTKGQQIATVGSSGKSTGPHVHIETFKADVRVDPMTVWDLAAD